jgi:NAD(P)-dependent dehydrogenase (short-subunit alcohol dehydrogenase family)
MNKTVLITGGAARVGAALARGLSEQGWTVIIHCFRSAEKARALVSELNGKGAEAFTVQGNLSVPQECDTLIHRASSIAGRPITALINNASTFKDDRVRPAAKGAASLLSRASYDYHMDANLRAPVILSQSFAEQAPPGASIINVIDQRVLKPNPQYFSYTLSKASLHWATKTLAQALAPDIRVNAIGPGPVLQNSGQTAEAFAREASETLLGVGSPPESLLQAVSYLLNAQAVTGQFLAVDGGQHLRWETPDIELDDEV